MKYALMTMIFALKICIIHNGQSDLLRLHRMSISVKSVGLLSVQVQTLQTPAKKLPPPAIKKNIHQYAEHLQLGNPCTFLSLPSPER